MKVMLRNYLVTLIGIIVVAVAGFFIYQNFFLPIPSVPTVNYFDNTIVISQSEEGSLFQVQEQTDDSTIIDILPEFNGKVVDYARRGGTEALIYDNQGVHVLQVRTSPDQEWYVLSTSPFEKRSVAVSQDGVYVAYAERTQDKLHPSDIAAWNIFLFDMNSKKLLLLNEGYAPHFIQLGAGDAEAENLVFSVPEGVATFNLESGEGNYYREIVPVSIEYAVTFSENGHYAAVYDPFVEVWNIFSVDLETFTFNQLGTLNSGEVVALHNDYSYILKDGGLYVRNLTGGEEVLDVFIPEENRYIISISNI